MEPMLKTMHKNCLSSQSCKFFKNYFSKIIFLHAHVRCVCIVVAKYQMAPAKTVVGVDRPYRHYHGTHVENNAQKLSKFTKLQIC